MPIQNGKYINPGWMNDGPPAIDDAELNAISDTLEKLDAGGGTGGGGGKRYARFVIGTSTNGWTAADCDYLCDGANDDVEIQAAIDALPQTGGEIKVLSGTYNLSQGLSFPYLLSEAIFKLHLFGCGYSTHLNFQSTSITTNTESGDDISISDLSATNFVLNHSNGGATVCVKDCSFVNSFFSGIAYDTQIVGNIFNITESPPGTYDPVVALYGGVNNLEESNYGLCTNNTFHIADGVSLTSVINGHYATIAGNSIYGGAGTSIGIAGNNGSTITGNTVYNGNISGSFYCTISGNYVSSGSIIASSSPITGNYVHNGYIWGSEASSVTGNTVIQEEVAGDACIIVRKQRSNNDENSFTVISGNSCVGGTVGILLNTNSYSNRRESHAVVTGNACSSSVPLRIESVWSDCLITGNMFPNGTIVDNGTNNTKANNFTGT